MTAMDGMHASDDNKSAFCYNAKGKLIHREIVILNGPRSPLTITPKNEEPELRLMNVASIIRFLTCVLN